MSGQVWLSFLPLLECESKHIFYKESVCSIGVRHRSHEIS